MVHVKSLLVIIYIKSQLIIQHIMTIKMEITAAGFRRLVLPTLMTHGVCIITAALVAATLLILTMVLEQ